MNKIKELLCFMDGKKLKTCTPDIQSPSLKKATPRSQVTRNVFSGLITKHIKSSFILEEGRRISACCWQVKRK